MREIPDTLLFWAMAHKMSELLFVAEESGCLAALARGASFDGLAQVTGWSHESLAAALHVLQRARLIECKDGLFTMTPGAARYLPLIKIERQLNNWHRSQHSLSNALKLGCSNDPLNSLNSPGLIEQFAEAMGITARETALRIRRIAGPSDAARFLDLGGADGSVAAELASMLPEATFTVIDRPSMQDTFHARVAAKGIADRVEFVPANLQETNTIKPLVGDYDVIMLLNVAHLLPGERLNALLCSIRESADPRALLVVREMFATEDASFGLADLMLIDWLRCGTLFRDDVGRFVDRLLRIGFASPRVSQLPGRLDTFVVARMT